MYTVAQVAELFFQEVFRLYGLPKNIVSNRDSRFMGGFWQEINLYFVGLFLLLV